MPSAGTASCDSGETQNNCCSRIAAAQRRELQRRNLRGICEAAGSKLRRQRRLLRFQTRKGLLRRFSRRRRSLLGQLPANSTVSVAAARRQPGATRSASCRRTAAISRWGALHDQRRVQLRPVRERRLGTGLVLQALQQQPGLPRLAVRMWCARHARRRYLLDPLLVERRLRQVWPRGTCQSVTTVAAPACCSARVGRCVSACVYRILGRLGGGGMGEVLRRFTTSWSDARRSSSSPQLCSHPQVAARFLTKRAR